MRIAGKHALVTGGTDGIGFEIARKLKAGGAQVVVAARSPDRLASARAEGFEAIAADLSNAKGCDDLCAALANRPLDMLINNAGADPVFDINGPIDLDAVDRAAFLNFNAPIHLIVKLISALRSRPEAVIVNVTSGLAIAPSASGPLYCGTKAGLRSFTLALRVQLKNTNIKVIEALPPLVDTAMTSGVAAKNKMSPQTCAAAIVDAIEAGRDEANIGDVQMLRRVYSFSPALARSIMIKL